MNSKVWSMLRWAGTACNVIGTVFVIYKSAIGMCLWLVGSIIFMSYYAFKNLQKQELVLFSVYTILNVYGVVKWMIG